MKRFLIILMAAMVFLLPLSALAEEEVVVASVTKLSGNFMSHEWGINTSDMDVRAMLHGYATVCWTNAGGYRTDPMVVRHVERTKKNGVYATYTFDLHKNLKYSDGTDITASDYVFSLLLLASPEAEACGAMTAANAVLEGYSRFHDRDALRLNGEEERTPAFSGVRLLDAYKFSVTVKETYEPYFYQDALFRVQPFPMHVIAPGCRVEDSGSGACIVNAEPEEGKPETWGRFCVETLHETLLDPEEGYISHPSVVSGPYCLDSYDSETGDAVFTKNEYYAGDYNGKVPAIESVRLVFRANDELLDELAAGHVDIVNKVTDGEVIREGLLAESRNEWQSAHYPRSGYGFIGLACEDAVTSSRSVRQAMAYAIDKNAFCKEFTLGYGQPVYGYYGIGQWMTKRAVEEKNKQFMNLEQYSFSPSEARKLLEKDGWTLNAEGNTFTAGSDDVRYKKIDGKLIPLELRWARTENNRAADTLEELSVPVLRELGFRVEIVPVSFPDMLADYYREGGRQYNMYLMATNFGHVFDPYFTFSAGEEYQGVLNTSGVRDKELQELAWDMRRTPEGNTDVYFSRWLAFQKRYAQVLPSIPLYSNTYFDFCSERVQGYRPDQNWSWASALLYATVNE